MRATRVVQGRRHQCARSGNIGRARAEGHHPVGMTVVAPAASTVHDVSVRLDRLAMRPVRAGAERAVDSVLAGPLPEAIVHSLVAHRVPERVIRELVASTPGQQFDEELQSLVDTLAGHVVRSPAFKQAVVDTIRSPEVRDALTQQTSDFASDTVTAARRRAARADDRAELQVRTWFRRPRAAGPASRFGGVATRGIALVVDAALAQLAFLVGAASVALVGSLAGASSSGWAAALITSVGWALVMTLYFGGFWSIAGQTPGMRLLGVRVCDAAGNAPSVPRALLRVVGLVLAIIPLGAGFVPVLFDGRRRGLHDFIARTQVPYA
jgi:uncharacterized RDD family membrane protein YckC